MTEITEAAVRLLVSHKPYTDSDYDDEGNGGDFTACEIDSDTDWPCDTAVIAQAALDHAAQSQESDRAERAILSSAEAYRLVEEARQMRAERDAHAAQVQALRAANARLRAFAENVRDDWGALTGWDLQQGALAALDSTPAGATEPTA